MMGHLKKCTKAIKQTVETCMGAKPIAASKPTKLPNDKFNLIWCGSGCVTGLPGLIKQPVIIPRAEVVAAARFDQPPFLIPLPKTRLLSLFSQFSPLTNEARREEREKMKAVIKGKYEVSEKASLGTSLFTLSAAAGDLRFKATATNATFSPGPSLEGISLAVEKPGAFIVDVNVPKKVSIRKGFPLIGSVILGLYSGSSFEW